MNQLKEEGGLPASPLKEAPTDESRRSLLYGIIAVLITGVLGFALGRNTNLEFVMTGPDGGEIRLNVAGGEIDYSEVMNAMFSDSFMVGAATEWLASYKSMVSVSDTRLADVIESNACDPIPETPLVDYLEALKACANEAPNRNLRNLALVRRGYPFHNVGVPLRVSVPEPRDWPPLGNASICSNDLWGRRLELVNTNTNYSIHVTASQRLECSNIPGVGTQIHLHPDNAETLFGRQLRGIDTLYAIPVDGIR